MRYSGGSEDAWILRTELGRWKKELLEKGAVCLCVRFFFGQNKKERKKIEKHSKIINAKILHK